MKSCLVFLKSISTDCDPRWVQGMPRPGRHRHLCLLVSGVGVLCLEPLSPDHMQGTCFRRSIGRELEQLHIKAGPWPLGVEKGSVRLPEGKGRNVSAAAGLSPGQLLRLLSGNILCLQTRDGKKYAGRRRRGLAQGRASGCDGGSLLRWWHVARQTVWVP